MFIEALAAIFFVNAPVTTDAERTRCQALARVIIADLRGQKQSLEAFQAAHPSPGPADQAIIDRKTRSLREDNQLFEALKALYISAPKPTAEQMAELRNTPYGEIKRQARECLPG